MPVLLGVAQVVQSAALVPVRALVVAWATLTVRWAVPEGRHLPGPGEVAAAVPNLGWAPRAGQAAAGPRHRSRVVEVAAAAKMPHPTPRPPPSKPVAPWERTSCAVRQREPPLAALPAAAAVVQPQRAAPLAAAAGAAAPPAPPHRHPQGAGAPAAASPQPSRAPEEAAPAAALPFAASGEQRLPQVSVLPLAWLGQWRRTLQGVRQVALVVWCSQ